MKKAQIIVVGGGIAGAAAVLRAAQYHLQTLWILGDRKTHKASRGEYVFNIDNMIGVHPDIVLDALGDRLEGARPQIHIGTRAIIDNVHKRLLPYGDLVVKIEGAATSASYDQGSETFSVQVGEQRVEGDALVLATGIMDSQPIIYKQKGGKERAMPNWIYPFANAETVLYCIRCEGHLTRGTRAAIVGHSETAAQVALMLAERYGTTVALLCNGEAFEGSDETRRLLEHFGIAVHESPIVDLLSDPSEGKGALRSVVLRDETKLDLRFIFVSLGLHRVYNELALKLGAELLDEEAPLEKRHVKIDAKAETSIRGLFAIGDMAKRIDEPVMRQIYNCQEYAVRAVDTIDRRRRSLARKAILGKL